MKTVAAFFYLLLLLPSATNSAPLTVNAVGDIMLAGSGEKTFQQLGYDYPFAATADTLRQGDIVIGNLEAPVTLSGEEFITKKFRYRLSPKAAPALKNAGFTHLSLANNHIFDFGTEGLRQTLEALEQQGLAFSGAGRDLAMARKASFADVKGVRIAFLSYSLVYPEEFFAGKSRAGTAPGYPAFFSADIAEAKKSADYVIVSFHWGGEGVDTPKPYQVAVGHKAIDAGADLVIGHHPHVVQGIEYYRNGVIFYSLGNFAFGTMSNTAGCSIIARVILDGGIKEVEVIPLNILNSKVRFQPRIQKEVSAMNTINSLERLSGPMGSNIAEVSGRYLVQRKTPNNPLVSSRQSLLVNYPLGH